MAHARVAETDHGIQGVATVEIYDQMQRRLRDKGLLETREILANGVSHVRVMELGPGPGYLGLEWLKRTQGTQLTGLDISADMIAVARRNAREYALQDRVEYVCSSGANMPFADGCFDAVFTASSLHEWSQPQDTLREIARVLKPGGRLFITDFRRDIQPLCKWIMWWIAKSNIMRAGLLTSIRAAYTTAEISPIVKQVGFSSYTVRPVLMGLQIVADK